jgi:hypothetical protein
MTSRQSTDMSKQNFAHNLKSLCKRQRSVAHVCRSLQINRQQFNKYLSGQVYPSKFNLSRICDFFKLSGEQFALGPTEFERLILETSSAPENASNNRIDQIIDSLPVDIEALSRYEGYYHTYTHSPGYPGKIVCCLMCIYRKNDRFYSNSVEHLWDKATQQGKHQRFKYKGTVRYLGDRIFITEYEVLAKQNIAHTVLFPSYRSMIDTLSGLVCGVSSLNSHLPISMRIEMKYLGKQINLRESLNACGLYSLDSKAIDQSIRDRTKNEILPHEYLLSARDQ